MSPTHRRRGRYARTTSLGFFGPGVGWALEKAIPLVTLAAGIAAVIGFGYLPYDYTDERRAETLRTLGTPVTVTVVEAYVVHAHSKGSDWWEVDGIRVRAPGLGDQWIELTGLDAHELEYVEWSEGWQDLPSGTGYDPPLSVRYTVDSDGQVNAMAESDIAYWADSGDWKFGLALGVGGLVVLLIGVRAVIRLGLDW